MKPRFSLRKAAKIGPLQHAARFVFGGLVAVCAAWIGREQGPEIGGLFLAFPALLPASLTLVKKQDGRRAAFDDARGAVVGSLGLVAFAVVIAAAAAKFPYEVSLGLAAAVWVASSVLLWRLLLKRSGAPSPQR